MFWAHGRQNEQNGSRIVPINLIKIFYELDVNDVKKLESSVFGLNTTKFFMNTTNIITTKQEANVLGTGRPKSAKWQ